MQIELNARRLIIAFAFVGLPLACSATPPGAADTPLRGALRDGSVAPTQTATASTAATSPATIEARVLRQSAANAAQSTADSSVEDFFQLGQSQRISAKGLQMVPVYASISPENSSKWRAHGYSRCLWHVLDNIGVPMFHGQDMTYIDPSIKETYLIPVPLLAGRKALDPENAPDDASATNNRLVPTSSQAALQKIPLNELEGVPLPTVGDETDVSKP